MKTLVVQWRTDRHGEGNWRISETFACKRVRNGLLWLSPRGTQNAALKYLQRVLFRSHISVATLGVSTWSGSINARTGLPSAARPLLYRPGRMRNIRSVRVIILLYSIITFMNVDIALSSLRKGRQRDQGVRRGMFNPFSATSDTSCACSECSVY
jgi:hypothetical protein